MLNNMKEDVLNTTLTTQTTMLPTMVNVVEPFLLAETINQKTDENPNFNPPSTPAAKSPIKTKTLLSWLKSATKSYDSIECISDKRDRLSVNGIIGDKECTCETLKPAKVTTGRLTTAIDSNKSGEVREKSPDAILRDFHGVQTLRHLWNKRISASEETARKSLLASSSSSSSSAFSNSKVKKLTKSIGCLVVATAASAPTTSDLKNNNYKIIDLASASGHKKRAQSLHDCTQLPEVEQFEQLSREEIDFIHREKDNFYKYKTAEQAAKHLAREAANRVRTKRLSAGITNELVSEDAHFPAIKTSEKGEHIHWLRREDIDIILKRKGSQSLSEERHTNANMTVAHSTIANTALSAKEDVISNDDNTSRRQSMSSSSADTCSDTLTPPATSVPSPQHDCHKVSSASSISSSKCNSIDSSSSNTAAAGRPVRRSSSAASRKYSFKTRARSYHHPARKMYTNKDGSTAAGNGQHNSATFSMVAKLTQQFNDIIQKDKKLLEEVKRKNGVLMARGGHVYKVVENTKENAKLSKTTSPSVSRNSSLVKDHHRHSSNTSTVQRNIKKFEKGDSVSVVMGEDGKPKVPAKSADVRRKLNELAKNKNNIGLSSLSKHFNLPLPSQQQNCLTEAATKKLEAAKKTHINSIPLEVVKEEAKTPIETEEKSILAAVKVVDLTIQNVSNVKVTESTYNADVAKNIINYDNHNVNNCAVNQAKIEAKQEMNDGENGDEDGGDDNKTFSRQTQLSSTDNVISREKRVEPEGQEDVTAESTTVMIGITNNLEEQQPHRVNAIAKTTTVVLNEIVATTVAAAPVSTITEIAEFDCNENNEIVTSEANVDDADVVVNDEKAKQRKHKYAKLYEKFRFRSPFRGGQSKKLSSSPSRSPEEESKEVAATEEAYKVTQTDSGIVPEPDAKILDALEVIDQKLKGLSVVEPKGREVLGAIVLCENDDFEQRVLPNSSFVYKSNADKQVANNQLIVTQAVNVTLVNNIEGEQMIMEQKELHNENIMGTEIQMSPVYRDGEEPSYEPIAISKESKTDINPQKSFLHRQNSTINEPLLDAASVAGNIEDIYQTLDEVVLSKSPLTGDNILNDYESIAGSCEQTESTVNIKASCYDGYEICEPPTEDLVLHLNRPTTPTPVTTIMRNTNDELPELPKPKRRLPKSPIPGGKRPSRPKPQVPCVGTANASITTDTNEARLQHLLNDNDDHRYYADDENIYDTIKGSHCYESLHSENIKLQKSSTRNSDTMSLTSNCYESITHYRRIAVTNNGTHTAGSSSGSTLTISSDQKTNSLYEVSLAAGVLYSAGSVGYRSSIGGGSVNNSTGIIRMSVDDVSSNNSNPSASDNSDEWIDISDTDADEDNNGKITKQQFIVVRERFKVHRSPDWSKRVRDKRLHQNKAISCIEDDSDHYYESLSPLSNKRHSMQLVERTNSHHKRNQDLPRYGLNASQRSKQYSASAHTLGNGISDDYDSFDTDTDDMEEHIRNHNDSGVDIHNVKLPDPPTPTNQVYAFVRKFKNLISNKKSPVQKYNSQQKLYENSSQFYINGGSSISGGAGNIYENSPKAKPKSQKETAKKPTKPNRIQDGDTYENTEFHTPSPQQTSAINADARQLSNSEKNLNSNSTELINTSTTLRSKSKSGKSFKSRLRKSLVGSTFDSKQQLSTLTPTRSTFYIEDPTHVGTTGELDSGFSEKTSSGGDLQLTSPSQSGAMPTPESQKFSTVARKAKKEAKIVSTQRRRTTIGIRPHEPPPPPPEDSQKVKHFSTTATTSWYAECGVFKNSSNASVLDNQSLNGSKSAGGSTIVNGSSWYTEAGLYQTSGISVASSSGSSGVSTGNEGGLSDDMPHSMFLNEPLYQIYSAAKLESISRDMEDHDSSTDGYEEIGQNGDYGDAIIRTENNQKRPRPSALQLIEPKNGPSRTLWSEIPEVINSCILPTMTPRQRGLQEAKFEIITSEASYLKSLNLLRSHYMNHPLFRDSNVVNARDRKALFAYIVPVHECSERLLTELESCWQDNIMLLGLSKRIYAIADKYFHVYISFCEHQGRMDRTLRRLKEAKGLFSQNLDLLEASPACCGLNLHSFLMLPMQRITRLPLLIDAVFSKCSPNDDEYDEWKMTLAIMNKIVTQCNDAANRCEQAYEIERISRQLEFPNTIRALAIAPVGVSAPGSKPRYLVKRGELTHLIWRGDDAKLTFGKKFTKASIYAFLFSDLLVLTKRKGENQFLVFDYCPRSMLTISSGDALPQLPTKDINQTGKNLILMTLLENHERKTIELVLSCPSVSEQERWLQAMRPPEAETPGEKLYEQWDCPQVITKHAYETKEPDVLNLEVGDVVNVSRKLPDGWYQGERIRDGAIGWFPGSYTEEVNSAHVRARNLKQRYRLLTFTATYLESQKRK